MQSLNLSLNIQNLVKKVDYTIEEKPQIKTYEEI